MKDEDIEFIYKRVQNKSFIKCDNDRCGFEAQLTGETVQNALLNLLRFGWTPDIVNDKLYCPSCGLEKGLK